MRTITKLIGEFALTVLAILTQQILEEWIGWVSILVAVVLWLVGHLLYLRMRKNREQIGTKSMDRRD